MDIFVKLNAEVAGKDKVARLLQYSCRTFWDSLDTQKRSNIFLIHKLKTLENLLSSFRKRKCLSSAWHPWTFTQLLLSHLTVLRFGKSLETFNGCLKSIHYNDAWLAFMLTVSKISQTLFLLTDHLIWLARSGLVRNVDVGKWTVTSSKYWLISLIMGVVRDIYEINKIISSYSSYKSLSACLAGSLVSIRSLDDVSRHGATLMDFAITYKHISLDLMKNLCDLFIPLNTLGFTKLSARTIGFLGMISSVAGLIAILHPSTCKLTPQWTSSSIVQLCVPLKKQQIHSLIGWWWY